MEVTITVDDRALQSLLASWRPRVNRAMYRGMTDATVLLLRDMKTYPAARPGSSYKRTGKLRDSWTRRVDGLGFDVTGLVGSDPLVAPYNAEVQHPDLQAAIHVGRWQTTETVINRDMPRIQGYFDTRMREAFAGT